MRFSMWCRRGELPLDAADEESAIEAAVAFALHTGNFVVLRDDARNEIAPIPPAPQTHMIPALRFAGLKPAEGRVALN